MKQMLLVAALSLGSAAYAQNYTRPADGYPNADREVTACDVKFEHRNRAVRFCSAYNLDVRLIARTGQRYSCDCTAYELPGIPHHF